MNRYLALLVLIAACAKADGGSAPLAAPPTITIRPLNGWTDGSRYFAPGDTVGWAVTWPAPTVAVPVGYSYAFSTNVALTNGTWTVIYGSTAAGAPPAAGATATPGPVALKLTAVAWDSVSPTFCVWGVAGTRVSNQQCVTWKVYRRLPPPGTPKIDSAATVTGLLLKPDSVKLVLGGNRVACAFKQFANGAVAEWTADRVMCDSIYTRTIPAATRALVTAAQQAHTDSTSVTCVSWASSNAAAVGLAPRAGCSAAVLLTGLQLTLRSRADQLPFRNVSWTEDLLGPVVTVSPTGLATCLRAGIGTVEATADNGLVGRVTITCEGAFGSFLATLR